MEKLTASAKKRKQPEESSQAVETEVKYQHLASKKQRVVAWKYDVFVSFRGEDIRKGFIDHLFKDFKQNRINAFRDYIDLPRGEEISSHLYKAIENSRILMVIFSKNYAFSSWCLRELVKILDSMKMEKPKHEVRILFYDVKPEVVRKQTESYAEAFAKHEVSNRAEVDKWREALSMAVNLSGWDLHDMTNGYESKFIDRISEDIHEMLCDVPLHVGEKLVGVDARLSKLNLVRFVRSSKVNMIGICGISGIGKTTIAKAIYRRMYAHFEGCCFCEDVQEATKRQGLPQVQTQIIHKITKTKAVNISCISEGIMVIKKKVECKPILLVLDDVVHHEQLDALAGSHDWFCPGSLIIFTGKDKQLLRSHGVDEIYDVKLLDDREGIELFCLYAFGQTYPRHDFKELSHEVVRCLQGHPLALKVVGKALFKKPTHTWRSELGRLQMYSNSEIGRKLRPSFDLLDSDQKRTFLDIACSLIGENRDLSARVLDSINCFADANIDVLVDKSLITISPDDSLQMHELIRRMAMEVLREEPERPIWLWGPSAVGAVLGENNLTETAKEVEVLVLLLEKSTKTIRIDCKAFSKMKKLRILKICYPRPEDSQESFQLSISTDISVKFLGSLDFLSNELRLIYWHQYPFKFLPSNFYPENVVAIDLSFSNIESFWTTPKCFKSLKVMKLRHCRKLTTTPDFTKMVNLERLILEGCVSLVRLHPSIGMLKKLVMLNMRDCIQIRSFPCKVEMDSLQVLILPGCLKMDNPTQVSGALNSLVKLYAYGTAITEFPSFISSLTNLQVLEICRYQQTESPTWWTSIFQKQPQSLVLPSLVSLQLLTKLKLISCNISEVCDDIGTLSCLESLDLSGNNFTKLPGSLGQLSRLQDLVLHGCKQLEILPELPPNIMSLHVCHCTSLQEQSRLIHQQRNLDYFFFYCPKLFGNVTIDSQVSVSQTRLMDSSPTLHATTNQDLFYLECLRKFFGGSGSRRGDKKLVIHLNRKRRIPRWFTNKSMGSRIKVELPPNWCFSNFKGYGICVVYELKESFRELFPRFSVNNFDGASLIEFCERFTATFVPGLLVSCFFMPCDPRWEKAKNFVTFTFGENNGNFQVKECGVRLVCDDDEDLKEEETVLKNGSLELWGDGVRTRFFYF